MNLSKLLAEQTIASSDNSYMQVESDPLCIHLSLMTPKHALFWLHLHRAIERVLCEFDYMQTTKCS